MSKGARIVYAGETSPNDDLIGKKYIDEYDSGDQVMKVWIIDAIYPNDTVWVYPVGHPHRTWWRSAANLRPLIAAFEAKNGPASSHTRVAKTNRRLL